MNDKQLLQAFKALANDSRLEILSWLRDPKQHFPEQVQADPEHMGVCVKHIQNKAGLSQSTISQYMSVLQKAGLVSVTRDGQWTYYKRNEENIAKLIHAMGEEL